MMMHSLHLDMRSSIRDDFALHLWWGWNPYLNVDLHALMGDALYDHINFMAIAIDPRLGPRQDPFGGPLFEEGITL